LTFRQPAPEGFTADNQINVPWGVFIDGNDDFWVGTTFSRSVVLLAGDSTCVMINPSVVCLPSSGHVSQNVRLMELPGRNNKSKVLSRFAVSQNRLSFQ
jgi:hypothetical protein